jgi:hypothetical protein
VANAVVTDNAAGGPTPAVRHLLELPLSERRDALEALVVAEYNATLLMTDDEDLPLTESYFELGFTSLRITEIKQNLEALLGCGISTTLLFNQPTVTHLMDHLTTEVFPELTSTVALTSTADSTLRRLWEDSAADLYGL